MYVRTVHNTSSPPFFTYVLHKCLSQKSRFKKKIKKKASERLLHKRKKRPERIRTKNRYISRFTKQKKRLFVCFAPFAGSRKEGLYYYFLQKGEEGCCPGAQQRGVNKLRRSQDDGGQSSSSSSPSVPPNAKHSPPEVQLAYKSSTFHVPINSFPSKARYVFFLTFGESETLTQATGMGEREMGVPVFVSPLHPFLFQAR